MSHPLLFYQLLLFTVLTLTYDVVCVVHVQKLSQLYIHIYLLIFGFFSHMGYYRVLIDFPWYT